MQPNPNQHICVPPAATSPFPARKPGELVLYDSLQYPIPLKETRFLPYSVPLPAFSYSVTPWVPLPELFYS